MKRPLFIIVALLYAFFAHSEKSNTLDSQKKIIQTMHHSATILEQYYKEVPELSFFKKLSDIEDKESICSIQFEYQQALHKNFGEEAYRKV